MKQPITPKRPTRHTWMRRNWGVVLIIALFATQIISLVAIGVDFSEAVKFVFGPNSLVTVRDRGGPIMALVVLAVITFVVTIALIISAIIKRTSRK